MTGDPARSIRRDETWEAEQVENLNAVSRFGRRHFQIIGDRIVHPRPLTVRARDFVDIAGAVSGLRQFENILVVPAIEQTVAVRIPILFTPMSKTD